MIVYPAIDLKGGRCVRLQQGDMSQETVFADDPVDAARRWVSDGAEWLHVVNLDGAVGRSGEANLEALRRILAAVDLPVQFGGGMRSGDDIDAVLRLGVTRVILGTVAVREPDVVADAVTRHGAERICVGIDARDGRVAVHGWTDDSGVDAVTLARAMRDLGIRRVVHTDVARDGMLTGVNAAASARLAQYSGLAVIASGGVSSLDDLQRLKTEETKGVEGVVIGMALYRGRVRLPEAIALLRGV